MSLHDIWRGDVMPLSGIPVSIGRNTFDPPAPVVPVFDIHARSLILHDSAGIGSSGIVQYFGHPASGQRLQLIPSNSGMQPIVTAVLFDAYDGTGGNSITTSATVVSLDTVRLNTHPAIFTLAGNVVQINASGTYIFEYRISTDATDASARTSAQYTLARQPPGGSFSEVAGARSFTYNRLSANGEDTANAKIILNDVRRGERFELLGQVIAGTNPVTQLQHGTSLTIRKLA